MRRAGFPSLNQLPHTACRLFCRGLKVILAAMFMPVQDDPTQGSPSMTASRRRDRKDAERRAKEAPVGCGYVRSNVREMTAVIEPWTLCAAEFSTIRPGWARSVVGRYVGRRARYRVREGGGCYLGTHG